MGAPRLNSYPTLKIVNDDDRSPEPVQHVTVSKEGVSIVVRRMSIAESVHCRRCEKCTFIAGPDGQGLCFTS